MTSIVHLLIVALLAGGNAKKLDQDRNAILSLAGCRSVEFHFVETFAHDEKYKPKKAYNEEALEWIGLVENTPTKISLQHLLITDSGVIIKHWREDWIYENTEFLVYDRDYSWKHVSLPASKVEGQWTQKVYQVDDGPRYEGSGTWMHVDGRSVWQATSDAPLPRREHTKRDDYNVMGRTNRITVYPNENKWVHEEDNRKIIRSAQGDSLLTEEYGRNPYMKTDGKLCEVGDTWWKKHAEYWKVAREAWDDVAKANPVLTLKLKGEGTSLYTKMFDLDKRVAEKGMGNKEALRKEIRETIQNYVTSANKSER